jgi:hypothetical protein
MPPALLKSCNPDYIDTPGHVSFFGLDALRIFGNPISEANRQGNNIATHK